MKVISVLVCGVINGGGLNFIFERFSLRCRRRNGFLKYCSNDARLNFYGSVQILERDS